MARAEIEHLASVIRVWADDHAKYGDPYEWVATVRWLNRTEVEILGYAKPITPSTWKAISSALQRMGIKKVLAVRYKDGERIDKWISIPTPFQQFYR